MIEFERIRRITPTPNQKLIIAPICLRATLLLCSSEYTGNVIFKMENTPADIDRFPLTKPTDKFAAGDKCVSFYQSKCQIGCDKRQQVETLA